ncbi:hypothetical protein IHE45_20G056600 [Dioscorea alata]|uniref:Uncharacterized protein n=2 Tax=Dioscorea alata TaxID=55571 RepID=A0ACB7TUI5_DIOAL|nr:hypothetical protein IHE45_20G056600 [Dioscorea alata]KAH7651429.1 hypothetical protein IHE45_20G056600 [Dioscorea alata]
MVLARILRSRTPRNPILNPNPSFCSSSLQPSKLQTLSSIFATPSPSKKSASPIAANAEPKKKTKSSGVSPPSNPLPVSRVMAVKGFPKEIPAEMLLLVKRLHDEGLLQNSNFMADDGEFDPLKIPRNCNSRNFLKVAAEKFGLAHQEIAKWLSGSDLKKVAIFGCPSVDRGTVFAAKRMRSFFSIQEDVTCRACVLKNSCQFVNKKVSRVEKIVLADVMRLLTMYALDSIPQQLQVPEDLKLSAGKLLKDVVNLSD